MFKGFVIAVLLMLGASQLDQYFCNGKYTDGTDVDAATNQALLSQLKVASVDAAVHDPTSVVELRPGPEACGDGTIDRFAPNKYRLLHRASNRCSHSDARDFAHHRSPARRQHKK